MAGGRAAAGVAAAVAVLACAAWWLAAVGALARSHLAAVHAAEDGFAAAEEHWRRGLAAEDDAALRLALRGYEAVLGSSPALAPRRRQLSGVGAGAGTGAPSAAGAMALWFGRWAARPLMLRVLHRQAAALELLRDNHTALAAAHAALLAEGYCDELLAEQQGQGGDAAQPELQRPDAGREYEKCVAPLARGTVLFAGSPEAAEAAFGVALGLRRPGSGRSALSWVTRWQLPDQHTPGLVARAWWPDHPAAAALEAEFGTIRAEFEALLAQSSPTQFTRRRADAWIPRPRDGWGMLPLVAGSQGRPTCLSPAT